MTGFTYMPENIVIQNSSGEDVNLYRKIFEGLSYYVDVNTYKIYRPSDCGEEPIGDWDNDNNKPIDPNGDIKAFMLDYETGVFCEILDRLEQEEFYGY